MDEDPGDSQSDWEVDDEIVDYAWKSRDELLQQVPEPTPLSTPKPTSPDEASTLLARFRPIRSTPQDLKRLLDAHANPDINVGEGNICPLDKVMTFARTVHVPPMLHMLKTIVRKSQFQVIRSTFVFSSPRDNLTPV